ncbi:MAG TPA: sigma-54 dependent transcriptional regulator [Dissulfurispiraceae bacterium]|nr:sigma-54 dependent transcriptional regulator [Dissulfurispiraceae bacterium]
MSAIWLITESREIEAIFQASGISFSLQGPKDLAILSGVRIPVDGFPLAFMDLSLDGWREWLKGLRHRMPVIAFSPSTMSTAIEAMRLGATDVVDRPLTLERIREDVERHEGRVREREGSFDDIVGRSSVMREVFSLIKRAAASESNVLITGESGTGKEPTARAIHRWSPRKDSAFMTLNCSAIPDTLLESELFGFEKGAFTGANYTKKGILEMAGGGTVFFDEIGDVSTLFQTKVLRVIQEGEIMRIGGTRHTNVDVRIIAATNKDLKLACKRGAFREDLFYRLNVINIHMPPLRRRMEDIPILTTYFIRKYAPKRKDIVISGITDEALNILLNYTFPGNVRELENIIEHAISFASYPEILPSDLPASLIQSGLKRRSATPKMKDAVASYEKELIWSALQEARGNISRAAAILGIYRQQLQRKIKQLKIAT